MRKIHVLTFLSLDGVMQAPGGPEEDTRDGFDQGGWSFGYFDEAGGAEMSRQMTPPFELLLGRRTYEIFVGFWPRQENETAKVLNEARKHVATHRPLSDDWSGTARPLAGHAVDAVRALRQSEGPPIHVHGSGDLAQTLLANDLVDELWLKTFPVTLGRGRRLFDRGTRAAGFALTECQATPSGVIFARYRRDGAVRRGSFAG